MTNNEKFNQALNRCQNPRRVFDALLAFTGDQTSLTPEERKFLSFVHDNSKRQVLLKALKKPDLLDEFLLLEDR